ncbi:unnamed protein product, partial [Vitis vinifera]
MGSSGYFTHLEIPGLGILPLKGRVRAVELMLLKKDEASLECWKDHFENDNRTWLQYIIWKRIRIN